MLLDKIDALKVLRAATDSERDALLVELGGRGKPEQDIIAQLSAVRPLRHPDRFEEAHRMMVRSIEVLDRNGPRQATVRRLGPLTPIAKWLVEQASGFIVKSYINKVTNRICGLYERREANSPWHTNEHHMLRLGRERGILRPREKGREQAGQEHGGKANGEHKRGLFTPAGQPAREKFPPRSCARL